MRFGVSKMSDWSTFGSLHISHRAASGTFAAGCKPRRLSNGQSKSDEARKPLMAWCGRRIVARYFRRLATVQPHKASCRTTRAATRSCFRALVSPVLACALAGGRHRGNQPSQGLRLGGRKKVHHCLCQGNAAAGKNGRAKGYLTPMPPQYSRGHSLGSEASLP